MFGYVVLMASTGILCIGAVTAYSGYPVRLVGGATSSEGRVEVLVDGTWGTVCDDGWGLSEAMVVCRQLNFSGAMSAPGSADFGQGTGAIVMDDVECTGSESYLSSCYFTRNHNCDHSEDAGVICNGQLETQSGTLRLVGDVNNEGRVEVYHNGAWGTICDDDWDIDDANVVCNQLGFNGASSAESNARFGNGSGPILLDNVDCAGDESRLVDCGHNGWLVHNCTHQDDAGARCNERGSNTQWYIAGVAGAVVVVMIAGHKKKKKPDNQMAAGVTTHVSTASLSLNPAPPSIQILSPASPQLTPPSNEQAGDVGRRSASVPALSASVWESDGGRSPSHDYSNWRTTADSAQGDVYEVEDSQSPSYSANLPPPPSYAENMDPTRGNLYIVADSLSQADTDNLPPPPSYEAVTEGNYQSSFHF
ncbi:putative DMBT1-like protein isoform X2 [Acanthaster planci]|uniref:DMBT1-like protein isoform X2 n=1 Tax=Acanthaster planci TaxID=133434 RepID=A0A8B7XNN1_ACAPL|nr:putative DMBT1-like protein isoform X2 [Acanthaster planci]